MSDTAPILNRHVPDPPWRRPQARRLPGTGPLDMADWIWVLDSYPAQMAERERLLTERHGEVHALLPEAMPAAQELLALIEAQLAQRSGFRKTGDSIRCPYGRSVPLDRAAPLETAGRLVQEDLCLLLKPEGAAEHLLMGAVPCFPSNWTLAQKLGRPMTTIHAPVTSYDATVAARVERLLDGVQPGRPLARSNALFHDDPALFQPRAEGDTHPLSAAPGYFRCERQCLLRLPDSGAVAFSIHTILLRRADLSPADLAILNG